MYNVLTICTAAGEVRYRAEVRHKHDLEKIRRNWSMILKSHPDWKLEVFNVEE